MIFLILGVVLCICVQAFFSGSEMALITCDASHLKRLSKKNNLSAKLALKLLKNPERLLVLSLIGVNISSVTNANLMFHIFEKFGDHLNPYLYSFILSTSSIVILGELVPKSVAQRFSMEWTLKVVRFLWVIQKILSLLLDLVSGYAHVLQRYFGGDPSAFKSHKFTAEDLQDVVLDTKSNQTDLLIDEIEMISNILELSNVKAGRS